MTININELRRLAQEATPGPWWVNQDGLNHGFERGVLEINANDWHALAGAWAINGAKPSEEGAANAAYIAAANPAAISDLLDRLEAAEKERNELRALVVTRFDHDYPPQFTQGHDFHELTEPVTAEHCRWFVAEIERLRAKIAEMERQEPVWWQTRTRPTWNDGTWGPWRKCSEEYAQDVKKTPLLHDWLYEARALYALPGAKGE